MRQNLRPAKRAVRVSWQEGHGVGEISLPLQENLEGRALPCHDGANFGVVTEPFTAGEPGLSRRRITDFFRCDHGVLAGKTCANHFCSYPFLPVFGQMCPLLSSDPADSTASGGTTTSTFPVATS